VVRTNRDFGRLYGISSRWNKMINDKKNNRMAGHYTTIEKGMQNLEKGGNAKSKQNKRFDRQGE